MRLGLLELLRSRLAEAGQELSRLKLSGDFRSNLDWTDRNMVRMVKVSKS